MNSKPRPSSVLTEIRPTKVRDQTMFPDASVETGEVVGLEKRSLIGKESAAVSQPRELMHGFPQAELNEAASAAEAFACLLSGGSR